jgi:hypothetical protein
MALALNGGTGIVSANIQDGTIVSADIAAGTILGSNIAAGTITADKLNSSALNITYPMLSTSLTETDNVARRVAKAWINFNGTGVIAIRDDFRCTTIADNGTGAYTVNWETGTFPDANYCVVANGGVQAATVEITLTSVATGSIGVFSAGFGSNAQDAAVMCAVAFD